MHGIAGRGSDSGASSVDAENQQLLWRRMHLSVLPSASALLQSARLGPGGTSVSLEASLGRPAAALFYDHRVQGRAVFPGAGYLELAVSGAVILTGEHLLSMLMFLTTSRFRVEGVCA